jgi:putative dehydrogenase
VTGDAVGVVGLGQMGAPMSQHLLDAGFAVVGHDLDPARADELANAGGRACGSPREVAAAASTVITSLPSPDALRAVLAGPDGLLAARARPLVVVETSTLAPEDKRSARDDAEAAGATLLDCPLSGTAGQARARDVVVYASGDAAAVEACGPLFSAIARSHHYLGPFGAGSTMKIVTNLLVAIHNVAAAEAFVLAARAGIDRRTFYEVTADSAGTSRMFQVRGPSMVVGSYDGPGVTGQVFRKDLQIIADFARSHACPTPLFAATLPVYLAALAQGLGAKDTAAVCQVLERLAGVGRPPGPA